MEYHAISLWRPWDLLVLLGWKSIETRTHRRFKSLQGLTIAIHSAQRIDPHWRKVTAPYLSPQMADKVERSILPGGHVSGVVEVIDASALNSTHSTRAMIDCGDCTRFGLFFSHIRILEQAIKVRGRQGIFRVGLADPSTGKFAGFKLGSTYNLLIQEGA